jgi:hypothetical protein
VNTTKVAQEIVTSPAAFSALAQLTSLPHGPYLVDAYAYFTGTVTAGTEDDNVELWVDGESAGTLLVPPAADVAPVRHQFVVNTAEGLIQLVNPAAATAGAKYHVLLMALLNAPA